MSTHACTQSDVLCIHNLTKHYVGKQGKRCVLDAISFAVPRGQCVGIVGRNGSGKTTLLKCCAGILTPTSGSIHTKGSVFYASGFGGVMNKSMTVDDNLRVLAAIAGIERQETKTMIARVLEYSQLVEYADTRVNELSHGMISRLAFFALMMMHTTGADDVIALDEATSLAGDESFRQTAETLLRERISNGATVLLVSHTLSTFTTLCDRVLLLEQGKITMDGNPEEVILAYKRTSTGAR